MKKKNNKKQELTAVDKRVKREKNNIVRTALFGTAFGLCASAIVGLSVALYYANESIATHKIYQTQMDQVYSRAYYDLLDGANDLDVTLRKIGVSKSKEMQQSLLYDVWSTAELAEENLAVFDVNEEGIVEAQKFVNQLGDFAHSCALRMKDGKPLSAKERDMLLKFAELTKMYKDALEEVNNSLQDGKMFIEDGGALESMASAFSSFVEPSFEYPEMIYDGPFSSSLENRKPKALTGDKIDENKGVEIVNKMFDEYNIKDVEYIGEGHGNIETLNFSLSIDGDSAYVQLSKIGGALVSYNSATNMSAQDVTTDVVGDEAHKSCQASAIEFASGLGYKNMQVVWSLSTDNECIVNLAPIENGAIIYPDLIKVKLVESESRVVGFDATHYIYNHQERTIQSPNISAVSAKSQISLPTHDEGRLCLIPMHETKEVLCYEFECEHDGTYYIYVDAMTGEEVNILYVIDDGTGAKTI